MRHSLSRRSKTKLCRERLRLAGCALAAANFDRAYELDRKGKATKITKQRCQQAPSSSKIEEGYCWAIRKMRRAAPLDIESRLRPNRWAAGSDTANAHNVCQGRWAVTARQQLQQPRTLCSMSSSYCHSHSPGSALDHPDRHDTSPLAMGPLCTKTKSAKIRTSQGENLQRSGVLQPGSSGRAPCVSRSRSRHESVACDQQTVAGRPWPSAAYKSSMHCSAAFKRE